MKDSCRVLEVRTGEDRCVDRQRVRRRLTAIADAGWTATVVRTMGLDHRSRRTTEAGLAEAGRCGGGESRKLDPSGAPASTSKQPQKLAAAGLPPTGCHGTRASGRKQGLQRRGDRVFANGSARLGTRDYDAKGSGERRRRARLRRGPEPGAIASRGSLRVRLGIAPIGRVDVEGRFRRPRQQQVGQDETGRIAGEVAAAIGALSVWAKVGGGDPGR